MVTENQLSPGGARGSHRDRSELPFPPSAIYFSRKSIENLESHMVREKRLWVRFDENKETRMKVERRKERKKRKDRFLVKIFTHIRTLTITFLFR